jgi:hypothetical protein
MLILEFGVMTLIILLLAVPGLLALKELREVGKGRTASVYFDIHGCVACRKLAAWVQRRNPEGLRIVDARDHPDRDLERLSYRTDDLKIEEDGIGALGRTLSHIHLGWAYVGAVMRLPGVCSLIQWLGDNFIAKPHKVERRNQGQEGE